MPPTKNDCIFGLHPVIEAIRSGREIEKILLKRGLKGGAFQELTTLVREAGIPFQYVPVEKLNRVTNGNHQGVIAFVSQVTYQPVENVLPAIYEKGESPFIVVLDGVTDVRNMGAVARSALCAGVHALVVPSAGRAMITAEAVKSSAGALNTIPVCREANLEKTINFLRKSGLKIVAAGEKAPRNYFEVTYAGPLALVLGSEEKGVSSGLLESADEHVRIPVGGPVGSLNVSAAAAVIIFEVVRQRMVT